MKLTAFTDYSLRVLMFLAAEPERRATIGQISTAFSISDSHLTKVVHFLSRTGWVATARGKDGGVTLSRSADQVIVGQVVRDTEGAAIPAECFDPPHQTCAISDCCQLRVVLAEAASAFYAVLDRYTLADITKNREMLLSILYFRAPSQLARAT
jgi:Rrf2 family nitric oxide-sensitive transcriptional repressor